jgi:Zn-dependent protease
MLRTFKLGTAFGIDLYVHWTFWLLPLFFFLQNLSAGTAFAALMVAVVLTVFGCILLHELGHALAARAFGIGTRDITLMPLGGVARLEGTGSTPFQEIVIALAGPAVNVAIAFGMAAGMFVVGIHPFAGLLSQTPTAWEFLLSQVLASNIALVVFNLVPAFPLDGGRVFRAFLEMFTDRLTATEWAAGVAKWLALGFVLLGIFGNPMLLLIAGFIYLAGQAELSMVRQQQRLSRRPQWVDLSAVPPTAVHASAVPDTPNFSGFTWDRQAGCWIEWRDGRPVSACGVVLR